MHKITAQEKIMGKRCEKDSRGSLDTLLIVRAIFHLDPWWCVCVWGGVLNESLSMGAGGQTLNLFMTKNLRFPNPVYDMYLEVQ